MKSLFNITKNNIKNGQKANPENCAIAKAIKDEMKNKKVNLKRISVLPSNINIEIFNEKTNKISYLSAKMPRSGENFIKDFDSNKKVLPFKLELNFTKV